MCLCSSLKFMIGVESFHKQRVKQALMILYDHHASGLANSSSQRITQHSITAIFTMDIKNTRKFIAILDSSCIIKSSFTFSTCVSSVSISYKLSNFFTFDVQKRNVKHEYLFFFVKSSRIFVQLGTVIFSPLNS